MDSISSIEGDIVTLKRKAQNARDEAERHRSSARNYDTNGYADKALSEETFAAERDHEAEGYENEVQDLEQKLDGLKAQAEDLKSQIEQKREDLRRITGAAFSSWL